MPWNLLFAGVAWALSLFGFGKTKESQAEETGEDAGVAKQTVQDQSQELQDVQKAKDAADNVVTDIATGRSKLRARDKYERPL